ncbi:hypothetical protein AJ79_01916 [Helicocarpus griseus UAMH5409]|uniref:CorA-like transporter domain-containing protein n=1 Tax=Helicocarpus griseus UAMH5409 TaxID=1447875 RepID=A0A2B7Y4V3_9EURO|nr:hypothetical protein AJ79_01916 [Helicocarpus griseus UAMH5409]
MYISEEQEEEDESQLFLITQQRSWTTLDISRSHFDDLLRIYNVFPSFWNYVFAFGRKSQENEFAFPGFRGKTTNCKSPGSAESYESAYILRRVELNGRALAPGQSPWSIRQTAVYHQININSLNPFSQTTRRVKSMFIVIAPSAALKQQLSSPNAMEDERQDGTSSLTLHSQVVAESMGGWLDYMAWLEENLTEQTNRVVLAEVGIKAQSPFRAANLSISFADRQILKQFEDSITNLQVISPTMLSTVVRIRDKCQRICQLGHEKGEQRCSCIETIGELNENIEEVKLYVDRAKALKERVGSTVSLLSDLLSYEEAHALKDLAETSHQESRSMAQFTEKSARDAAAVKVLTIIGLVYLPTTIVLNFFSTEFVSSQGGDKLKVSTQAWILAAVSIPFTVITVTLWWLCVRRKNSFPRAFSQPSISRTSIGLSFLSSISRKKNPIPRDPECGEQSPTFTQDFAVGTLSTATTLKHG